MMIKNGVLSTKANTLKNLKNLVKKSKIVKIVSFSLYDWKNHEEMVLEKIQREFNPHKIIVRSSAINEDSKNASLAGQFESISSVDSKKRGEIKNAINTVFSSYKKKG